MTQVPRNLHWLPVVNRCQLKILLFTYKSLKSEALSYISDLLNWYQPNRPLRSANTTSIIPKRYRTQNSELRSLFNIKYEELAT